MTLAVSCVFGQKELGRSFQLLLDLVFIRYVRTMDTSSF